MAKRQEEQSSGKRRRKEERWASSERRIREVLTTEWKTRARTILMSLFPKSRSYSSNALEPSESCGSNDLLNASKIIN